ERDRITLAGVLDGVLRELEHGLGDALGVQAGLPLGDLVDAPAPVGQGGDLRLEGHGEQGDVHALDRAQEVRTVRLGQGEQVGDDPAHPVQLPGDQTHGGSAGVRVVVHELQVPADDRDGGAQLVPGVVDETL